MCLEGMSCQALHWAARYGRSDKIQKIAAGGVGVDERDLDSVTPLMRASRHNQFQAVVPLLICVSGDTNLRGAELTAWAHEKMGLERGACCGIEQ
jgi:ankyrin repeat protein